MTNLKTASFRDLTARLARLETAARYADARGVEARAIADAWEATRSELDSRPTSDVLAAL